MLLQIGLNAAQLHIAGQVELLVDQPHLILAGTPNQLPTALLRRIAQAQPQVGMALEVQRQTQRLLISPALLGQARVMADELCERADLELGDQIGAKPAYAGAGQAFQRGFTGAGQADPPRGPVQQACAQPALHLGQVAADHRRRDTRR